MLFQVDDHDLLFLELASRAERARAVLDGDADVDELATALHMLEELSADLTPVRRLSEPLWDLDGQVGEWRVAVLLRLATVVE